MILMVPSSSGLLDSGSGGGGMEGIGRSPVLNSSVLYANKHIK